MEHDFEMDCIDLQTIKAQLMAMVEQLSFKLRQDNLVTAKVIVKVKYNNLDTETKQSRISYTSLDHILKKKFSYYFSNCTIEQCAWLKSVFDFPISYRVPIRSILFEDTGELLSLYNALDTIRNKYGVHSVGTSSAFQNYRTKSTCSSIAIHIIASGMGPYPWRNL